MSQRDLIAELRASRIAAPDEVRERVVRLIAVSAGATPPQRRFTWRRGLILALPVAAAIAASIVYTRPSHEERATATTPLATLHGSVAPTDRKAFQQQGAATLGRPNAAIAPAPARGRAQRYGASLTLRVPNARAVSDGVKRALQVTAALGGYPTSVHASTRGHAATAELVLKVPREHVQQALSRLSTLGAITGEHVDVQDVQAGLNTTDRTIARLQRQLRNLRAEAQTDAVRRRIETTTARVQQLQRARAAAVRAAHYATVDLHLATPAKAAVRGHGHGPLHGLVVAFRWIGIGIVYALALGVPFAALLALIWLALRTVRRRREDALLSRP
ncbi:MAG: DUF4349 domain-containing protein [Gaiellaceae bacterium]